MNYQQAVQFLNDLQLFKIKLGLDSMKGFLNSLDTPQAELNFLHVGGTNGKGSVGATLLAVLSDAGYRVGLYTSPHLSSVRERFKINNQYMGEDDFIRNTVKIKSILNGRQITYFEFTTTMALLWFAEQKPDIVIMEVGMGGRLDATNIITPLVSIITNVSMDHEAHLGDTLTKVSTEKAGIIKANVPVVSGATLDESGSVLINRAQQLDAPFYLLGRDFLTSKGTEDSTWNYHGIAAKADLHNLTINLNGDHQISNCSLVLATLELIADRGFKVGEMSIRRGLANISWPGRLEYFTLKQSDNASCCQCKKGEVGSNPEGVTQRFLLDGAHNPAGVDSLKSVLQSKIFYKSLIGIWASMADKDIKNCLLPIAELFDQIIITRPESDRSARPEEIRDLLPQSMHQKISCQNRPEDALQEARSLADPEDLICIAGSLYLVGKARSLLLGELVK